MTEREKRKMEAEAGLQKTIMISDAIFYEDIEELKKYARLYKEMLTAEYEEKYPEYW
jgi:hypothetical protein